MMKTIDLYYPYNNNVVTDHYFHILVSAFERMGVGCHRIDSLAQKRSDGVLVAIAGDASKARKAGYRKVFLWLQGIIPEESYLRHHSRVRRLVLSGIERRGLKAADFVFYVSAAMREHLENKYHLPQKPCYVMPCFNDELHEEAFHTAGKYENNVFLYAGSMEPWQCFRKTAALYAELEKRVPNASFRVLTKDQDAARANLEELGVRSYSISFTAPDKIGEELKQAKFGFSLREDSPVNRVATPTKLSTYVAFGVIPIYSACLQGFYEAARGNPYCLCVQDEADALAKIERLCGAQIHSADVYNRMRESFGEYYSSSFHIPQITEAIGEFV